MRRLASPQRLLSTPTRRRTLAGAAVLALAGAVVGPALAHEDAPRTGEQWHAHHRLLVSDSSNGDIVVVDDGEVTARLSTPPAPISLATNRAGTAAFVMRGRDTTTDHLTMIDTAYDAEHGEATVPFISRTVVDKSPGGVHNGHLPEFDGTVGVAEEGAGTVTWIEPDSLPSLSGATSGQLRLAGPDHYTFVPVDQPGKGDDELVVGYVGRGIIASYNPTTGAKNWQVNGCRGLHGGTISDDQRYVTFACPTKLVTIDREQTSPTPISVPYPGETRSAVFSDGTKDVRWGSTENAHTTIQRVDTSTARPEVSDVPLAVAPHSPGRGAGVAKKTVRTLLRQSTTPDGRTLLVLTHQGQLQVRDGDTGDLRYEVATSPATPLDFHEHTDRAEAPEVTATNEAAYATVPATGEVVKVNLAQQQIVERIKVGGMPTRAVLLTHGDGHERPEDLH